MDVGRLPKALNTNALLTSCSWAAQAVYLRLLLLAESGSVAIVPGLSAAETIRYSIVGLSEHTAPAILQELEGRALVRVETDRLSFGAQGDRARVPHELQGSKPRGSSSTERMRRLRDARKASLVTSQVTGEVTPENVTSDGRSDADVTPENSLPQAETPDVTPGVTGPVADSDATDVTPDVTPSRDGQCDAVTPSHGIVRAEEEKKEKKEAENLSSLLSLSLSPPFSPSAPEAAKPPKPVKAPKPKPAPPPDPQPAPGTLAARVLDAILGDSQLAPITAGPGEFAMRVCQDGYCPGVDVLAEIRNAGEYASRTPGKYIDGRAFLARWLRSAAERAARLPKPRPPGPAPVSTSFDPKSGYALRDELSRKILGQSAAARTRPAPTLAEIEQRKAANG